MRIDLAPEFAREPDAGQPQPVAPTRRYARVKARSAEEKPAALYLDDSNFQELFQGVYDAALITNRNGTIIDANVRAVQFLDFERDELRQRNVLDILSGADEALLTTIADTLIEDRFVLIQAYCARRDGSLFPAEISTNLLNLSGNDYLCFFIRDITRRIQAEELKAAMIEEIKKSNADLREFAYVVSHDLQEPLRKITTFGGLLRTRCAQRLEEDGREYLERMENAAFRMQELIMALLSLSRVSTRAQPATEVALNTTVEGVLADLEPRIQETDASIEVGRLPVIQAEPVQMRQVFQNLIVNALKFHRPDVPPAVRIYDETEGSGEDKQDESCTIVVEDDGIGFDARHREKVFGIFQRLHTRSEYEGTGIGLAVCRKIIERHGGTITAESEPGQGCRFTITLPRLQTIPEGAGKREA
jgi:PAS domain S-box-containing protein